MCRSGVFSNVRGECAAILLAFVDSAGIGIGSCSVLGITTVKAVPKSAGVAGAVQLARAASRPE